MLRIHTLFIFVFICSIHSSAQSIDQNINSNVSALCGEDVEFEFTIDSLGCNDFEGQIFVETDAEIESYFWIGAGAQFSFDQNPEVILPGAYFLTATDVQGCEHRDTVFMEYKADAFNHSLDIPRITCENQEVEITIDPSLPDYQYEWGRPNNQTFNAPNEPVITVDEGGIYYVTITRPSDNCAVREWTVVLTDTIPPMLTFTHGDLYCDSLFVELSSNALGFNVSSVSWSGPGIDETNENDIAPVVSQPGVYYISGFGSNGCSFLDSTSVDLVIRMTDIIGPTSFCAGSSSTLCAASDNDSSTFLWSTGEQTECIVVNSAGTYSVEVFDGKCVAVAEVEIEESTVLTPFIQGDNFCEGQSTVLSTSDQFSDYQWTNSAGDMIEPIEESSPWAIEISEAGDYTLWVSDGSCEGQVEYSVNEITQASADIFDLEVCNSDAQGDPTIVDLSTAVNNPSGPYLILDEEGMGIPGDLVDFNGYDPGIYIFEVTIAAVEPCPDITYDLMVEVKDCLTSIEYLEQIDIYLYPQVTSDLVFLEFENPRLGFQLLNIKGHTLLESDRLVNQLDLSSYQAGTYFLKIVDQQTEQLKFFKLVKI